MVVYVWHVIGIKANELEGKSKLNIKDRYMIFMKLLNFLIFSHEKHRKIASASILNY